MKDSVTGDFIRREDAIEAVKNWINNVGMKRLEDVPSVHVAPLVHGKWEERYLPEEDLFMRRRFYCSACGSWNTYGETDYCPDCGAKMKKETTYGRH